MRKGSTRFYLNLQVSMFVTAIIINICSIPMDVSAAMNDDDENERVIEIIDEETDTCDAPVMTIVETEDVFIENEGGMQPSLEGEIHEIEQTPTVSENEIAMLARVVMSEGCNVPYEGKRAICECVLNRVESDEYPDTIADVINQPNQFWTGNNGEPNPECYQAVTDSISARMFPEDMYWFQKGKPSYGYECYYDGYHHYSSKTQH